MGNSTGLILPKPLLAELGVECGAEMDLVVDDGRVIATPIRRRTREGWEADAERIGAEASDLESEEWLSFGNEADARLAW